MESSLFENRRGKISMLDERPDKHRRLECPPHMHPDVEFVAYFGGKTTAYADANVYELRPGDIFIAFPNQVHRFKTDMAEEYIGGIFPIDLVPEFREELLLNAPRVSVVHDVANRTEVRALLEAWKALGSERMQKPYFEQAARGIFLSLFSILLPEFAMKANEGGVARTDSLKMLVNYCNEHFSEDLCLDKMEKDLHLSRYYLSHLFSDKLGISFVDYLNSLRVGAACRFLTYTSKSITEISGDVGYNSQRSFNRAFIRIKGESPSEYRKRTKS